MSDTYVVSKTIAKTKNHARAIIKQIYPHLNIKDYGVESGYDDNGTLLNHRDYFYFQLRRSK